MAVSLSLRPHGRSRITLRARVRVLWLGWLRKRYSDALKVAKAHEVIELERIRCNVDRLEQAALIGSSAAARALAEMSIDRIGTERRRLAGEASDRLRAMNHQFQF